MHGEKPLVDFFVVLRDVAALRQDERSRRAEPLFYREIDEPVGQEKRSSAEAGTETPSSTRSSNENRFRHAAPPLENSLIRLRPEPSQVQDGEHHQDGRRPQEDGVRHELRLPTRSGAGIPGS